MLAPDDPRHGTTNGYRNLRCRCRPCTDAWVLSCRYVNAAFYCGRRLADQGHTAVTITDTERWEWPTGFSGSDLDDWDRTVDPSTLRFEVLA